VRSSESGIQSKFDRVAAHRTLTIEKGDARGKEIANHLSHSSFSLDSYCERSDRQRNIKGAPTSSSSVLVSSPLPKLSLRFIQHTSSSLHQCDVSLLHLALQDLPHLRQTDQPKHQCNTSGRNLDNSQLHLFKPLQTTGNGLGNVCSSC